MVAVGRAVEDTGWVGVFGMGTVATARGRGAASSVLAALASWAGGRGARLLYLQVEREDEVARALYDSAGFVELAGYHYRHSR